jgi:gas vesicle protein
MADAQANGKHRMIIREREYEALSWHGLKTLGSLVMAIVAVVAAILTAYYTAEAGQESRIGHNTTCISNVQQHQTHREEMVDSVLVEIKNTLVEQSKLMRESRDTLVEVQTVQKLIRESLAEVKEDVEQIQRP